MKVNKHIHNLDTLEKEIYRQKLILIAAEKQLEKDVDYFRENIFTIARNSIKKGRRKEERNSSFFDQLYSNEPVREMVSGITSHITDRVSGAIDHLITRLFQKHR